MATVKFFEDLNCWRLAREVAKGVGALCRREAFKQDDGLRGQIQRSSGSIMDNIAEGFDRGSRGESVQFLGYAKGSAGENKSQLYRALDNEFISQECFDSLLLQVSASSNIIQGLVILPEQIHGARRTLPETGRTPHFLRPPRHRLNKKQETRNKKQETRNKKQETCNPLSGPASRAG